MSLWLAHAERQPKGYDLEHVCKIGFPAIPRIVPCTSEGNLQTFWFEADGGSAPAYQAISCSGKCATWLVPILPRACLPGYTTDSVHVVETQCAMCLPNIADVAAFAVQECLGLNSTASPLPAVVTRDWQTVFSDKCRGGGREFLDYYSGGLRYRVSAVCALQKTDDLPVTDHVLTPFPVGSMRTSTSRSSPDASGGGS